MFLHSQKAQLPFRVPGSGFSYGKKSYPKKAIELVSNLSLEGRMIFVQPEMDRNTVVNCNSGKYHPNLYIYRILSAKSEDSFLFVLIRTHIKLLPTT